jgi:hypothetical protein
MEAITSVKETDGEGVCGFGVSQVTERSLKLHGWTKERRVVVSRKLIPEFCTKLTFFDMKKCIFVTPGLYFKAIH